MYCSNCGKKVNEKAVVCVGCGVPLKSNSSRGKGIASMVLGIIAVLVSLVILFDLPSYEDLSYELEDYTTSFKLAYAATYTLYLNALAITGICLAFSERKINVNGYNNAGIWLNSISLIISACVCVYIVFS